MANQPTTQEVKDYIVERAKALGVDPQQALALAQVESSYKTDAVSKTGAAGVYQLFPDASKDAGYDYNKVKSDWKTNVDAGITYYGQKLKEAGGNVPVALGYYNQGRGGFNKQMQTGQLAPEVKKYITHPAFAPFVNDTLSQAGNPLKPLLAKQA
ncbi:transglycosylase SLT domain-containing protein, partial [Herbiconiux daphne]